MSAAEVPVMVLMTTVLALATSTAPNWTLESPAALSAREHCPLIRAGYVSSNVTVSSPVPVLATLQPLPVLLAESGDEDPFVVKDPPTIFVSGFKA
tara:strand:- start:2123 stop:2410 length:288 start_codon:yes stop_codon:yes gene_type:complete